MTSLQEKIGQMLLIGFRGLELKGGEPVLRDLAERNIGAVILFDKEMADTSLPARNIQSPGQVKSLVDSLKRAARGPLLVAIDQEGGRINRLKAEYGFPESISHEELGAINDPSVTFEQAEKTARTLAGLGINFNLAPVVDLDANENNPIIKGKRRSFSADPEIVARHAAEFCRAHRKHGILTCAKHFPGHGSARADTHLGLVDVTPYWAEKELVPFQRLIDSKSCDAIMTAHVFNASLDSERPATLSSAVLQGILRKRLHFDGVILSDDMEMKAIASHYGLEQAMQLGIQAGLDMLCFGNNMNFDANIGAKASEIISRLVQNGAISETRIDESHQRIQKMKQRLAAN